ncbi:hypothetical protein DFH09DRAFT_1319422 [Mycena vulgaris]|nr:hypothetical protein DFH09DRAFT_1319422 [Mycena vulgaris]
MRTPNWFARFSVMTDDEWKPSLAQAEQETMEYEIPWIGCRSIRLQHHRIRQPSMLEYSPRSCGPYSRAFDSPRHSDFNTTWYCRPCLPRPSPTPTASQRPPNFQASSRLACHELVDYWLLSSLFMIAAAFLAVGFHLITLVSLGGATVYWYNHVGTSKPDMSSDTVTLLEHEKENPPLYSFLNTMQTRCENIHHISPH